MTNNKETITTSRTIKTVLFAFLIAALILPFSGMNYAQAEMSDSQKERIIKKIQLLEDQIENATDESIKEKLQARQQAMLEKLYEEVEVENMKENEVEIRTAPPTANSGGTTTEFEIYGVHKGCDNGN